LDLSEEILLGVWGFPREDFRLDKPFA